MDLRGKHVAIEGVIGVGKTSLARLLAERTGARLVLEAPDANPFLENFYKDQRRFSFPTQMFFLVNRYHELKDLRQPDLFHNGVVSDYLFQKDRIFANLNLSDQELALYESVAALLEREIPAPDLVVYLQAGPEVIWSRIQQRGRPYEKAMDPQYTATLAEAYNYFFFHYKGAPLLIVNTNELNFVDRRADLEGLIARMEAHQEGVSYVTPGAETGGAT